MGFKGKPGARGGILSTVGRVLGGAGATRTHGMTQGLYRVSKTGDIIKVSKPKRKKGVRLPNFVYEMMRENIELSKDVRRTMIIQAAVHAGTVGR